jgi:hypothetical protein
MRWEGNVACMRKMHTTFFLESLKGKDHLKYLGVDRTVTSEWISGKEGGKVWAGCIWLRIGTTGRLL